MIKYSLACDEGHVFDEWFDNMADYDQKAAAGELVCPVCGGIKIQKSLMAPNIGASKAAATPAAPPCGAPACGSGMCPSMMA
ncbi:MAG: DUF1178 family protein [Rhodospirillaceae bacterium]